jgi:two-component system, OmpR family, heavy metal sensor histidine kinase CusS
MTFFRSRPISLVFRVTASHSIVLCLLAVALGAYSYHSMRRSQEERVEQMISGRASYYAGLVHQLYSVAELREKPVLIINMLGAEGDVLIFRNPSGEPIIAVNPQNIPVPPPTAMPQDGRRRHVVTELTNASGADVYWASAITTTLQTETPIEVLVGHPMTGESGMLALFREQMLLAIIAGIILSAAVSYILLIRGLRPVHAMARQAAQINPGHLDVRLDPMAAPTELRRLALAFNDMLDRLADGYQRLSQFSADLAHEIRTPLGVLIGQTQVTLAKPRSVDEYQQILDSNLEEFERLRRLSENMLFLARAENGRQHVQWTDIDMGRELHKIADYFEGPALDRNITFDVDASGVARADADLFRRAVSNLVANAIHHGVEGTIVRLKASVEAGRAAVIVENKAPWMGDEQLGRLFDRFYRGDASRTAASESHGLGLAIVDTIMRLHQGDISVSRPAEDEIRFRLSFPSVDGT